MEKATKFNGWLVMVGCFIIMLTVQGGIQIFAVTMPSIMKATGTTLTQISLISTIATAVAFCCNMIAGPLMKKIGLKWTLLIGLVCCSGHMLVYAYSSNLFLLYVAAAVAGVAIALGTVAPCSVLITNWFYDKRATTMSVVIAGSMFGGAILMPLAGLVMKSYDYQTTYLLLSIFIAILAGLSIIFLVSESPEKKGQKPYGYEKMQTASNATSNAPPQEEGVTAAEARKTASFWLIMVGVLLIGLSTNVENFLPAFWQKNGLNVATASSYMGIYAFIAAVAALVLGRITDKIGGKVYVFITSCLFIIGTLIILNVGVSGVVPMFIGIIVFAVGGKKVSTLSPPLITAESFGRKDYKSLIGIYAGMLQLGICLSNPVIGSLYQYTGNYTLAFSTMMVLGAIALVLIQVGLRIAPIKAKTMVQKTAASNA